MTENLAFQSLAETLLNMLPYLPVFTLLAAIAGWFIIIHNTKKIASRTETHALVAQIMSTLDGLDRSGRAFWAATSYQSFLAQSLAFEADALNTIESVRQLYELMGKRKLNVNISTDFLNIRQSLTLDIEGADQMTIEERLEKAGNASNASRKLKEEIYSLFIEQYRPVT